MRSSDALQLPQTQERPCVSYHNKQSSRSYGWPTQQVKACMTDISTVVFLNSQASVRHSISHAKCPAIRQSPSSFCVRMILLFLYQRRLIFVCSSPELVEQTYCSFNSLYFPRLASQAVTVGPDSCLSVHRGSAVNSLIQTQPWRSPRMVLISSGTIAGSCQPVPDLAPPATQVASVDIPCSPRTKAAARAPWSLSSSGQSSLAPC